MHTPGAGQGDLGERIARPGDLPSEGRHFGDSAECVVAD